jgi:hypothetical protein
MKKLFYFLIALLIFNYLSLNGQWIKSYGGLQDDEGWDVLNLNDGYIVLGSTQSFGAGKFDFWVFKLNFEGEIVWQKSYGGLEHERPYFSNIQKTDDNGFVACGHTYTFGPGNGDAWVVKFGSNGDIDWEYSYGAASGEDYASHIQQISGGGYVVAGHTHSYGGQNDLWVLMLKSNGRLNWAKRYDLNTEGAIQIIETYDKHLLLAGFVQISEGGWNYLIVKMNIEGVIQWKKVIGGAGQDNTRFIEETQDNGFIVAGYTNSFGAGGLDAWIVKFNDNGEVDWQKTYGGVNHERIESIHQTSDGGYIATGYSDSFGSGLKDVLLLKLFGNGDIEWQKTFGGGLDDRAFSVQLAGSESIIVAGYTESFGQGGKDVFIMNLDADGNSIPTCIAMDKPNLTAKKPDFNSYSCGEFSEQNIELIGNISNSSFATTEGIPFTICAKQTINASVIINPKTLNKENKGKWVTCYIELPKGNDVNDIDITTVELEYDSQKLSAERGGVQGNLLMVKFSRQVLISILKDVTGYVELKVTGNVDNKSFEGTDTIIVR